MIKQRVERKQAVIILYTVENHKHATNGHFPNGMTQVSTPYNHKHMNLH
jgi:hypothetical protein